MLPTDEQGHNIFHVAAANGVCKPLIKLLSTHKKIASVALAAKDSQGRTPADIAALHGNLRALRLILDYLPDSYSSRGHDKRNFLDILRHEDAPYTYQIRTRMAAWGSASIADSSGLTGLDQPQLPQPGIMRFAPRSVVKMAISPSQALVICQRSDFKRFAFATRNLTHINATLSQFIGAATSQHSVLVTQQAVFTWGKNQYGQLAQSAKTVDYPVQIDDFIPFRSSSLGGFEALTTDLDRTPVEPLVDTECNSHYSVAWTTSSVYSWGLNSGQVPNADREKIIPTLVHTFSRQQVQAVACLDNAIVVLAGHLVSVFMDGDRHSPGISGTELRGRGQFFAVLNESGRLQLYKLTNLGLPVKIPVPKAESVVSFDVAETGLVVVATKSAVYTWHHNELAEVPGTQRYNLRKVCCDARGTSFLACQEYFVSPEVVVGGTTLIEDMALLCPITATNCTPRIPQPFSFFEDSGDFEYAAVEYDWENPPTATNSPGLDATLVASDNTEIRVHKSILLGRCPGLANPLTTTRGGTTVRHNAGSRFEFTSSPEALVAFVQYLYTSSPKDSPPNSLGKQYRDLQSLVQGPLAIGMLRSKSLDPDVTINLSDSQVKAHSVVLKARSLFFSARLSANWNSNVVDLTQYSKKAFMIFLDFLYSGRVSTSLRDIVGSEGQAFETLIEIWYIADELMHSQLTEIVESALVECINFDTCLDIITILPGAKRLYNIALDFYSRHMDYFIRDFGQIPNALADTIETYYRKSHGTKVEMGDLAALMDRLTTESANSSVSSSPSASANASATASAESSARSSATATPVSSTPVSRASPEHKFQIKQSKRRGSQAAAVKPIEPPKAAVLTTPRHIPSSSRQAGLGAPVIPWRASSSSLTPASASLPSLPRLGQQASPLPRLGEAKSPPGFRTRTTSVPKRLSQKERRKLQLEAESVPETPAPAPWTRPAPAVASHSLSEQMALLSSDRQRSSRR